MTITEIPISKTISRIVKIIFSFCAFYFLLMGISLIFLPEFLIRGVVDAPINPTIIGMLRGAGGSIIPYSLLYIFIALDPFKKSWALFVILAANIIAILLDLVSVIIGEYNMLNAIIDLPVEIISIIGIILIFWTKKIC
jgi:hypothetical protein